MPAGKSSVCELKPRSLRKEVAGGRPGARPPREETQRGLQALSRVIDFELYIVNKKIHDYIFRKKA